MKKYFNQISNKIYWIYLATFSAMLLLISLVLMIGINYEMTKQLGGARVDVLKQIGERINSINNSTITISNLYCHDEKIMQALESEDGGAHIEEMAVYLDKEKQNYDEVFGDIGIEYEIVIIGENKFTYASEDVEQYNFGALEKQLWYRGCYSRGKELEFISSFHDGFGNNEKRVVFGVFRNIYGKDGKRLGTLIVKLEEGILYRLYENILDNGNHIYVIDEAGKIVSDQMKERLGLNFINVQNFQEIYGEEQYHTIDKLGRKVLLSYYYDEHTNWTIIEEIPCSILFSPLYQSLMIIGIVFLICGITAVIVSRSTAQNISRPLLLLCDTMNQVKEGNLDVISDIEGYEEIERLKDSFNDMAYTIRKLLEEIQLKEKNKREMELDFLRLQINPHFLYNTLFSIQCLTETGRNEESVYMMGAFIALLRGTLSVNDQYILVAEEMANVEKYLILQQLRYRDKVFFEIDIEEESKNCYMPPFLLQPIVENAIFHGIEGKGDCGMIVVESKIEKNELYLSISDDGIGMTEKVRNQLLKNIHERNSRTSDSIGMSNVSERIRLNFGEQYGIDVVSNEGIGTRVTLKMPVLYSRKENDYESYGSR